MPSDANGKLTGLVFEKAMMPVSAVLPKPTAEMRLAALDRVQMLYAREGFTWAQDGATTPGDLTFLTSPEAQQRLRIDLALLPFAMTTLDTILQNPAYVPGAHFGRVKLQGIKFTLDGSPQARELWLPVWIHHLALHWVREIEAALHAVAPQCIERDPQCARVLGVHLEGPYISPDQLGAQPPHAQPASMQDILRERHGGDAGQRHPRHERASDCTRHAHSFPSTAFQAGAAAPTTT